MGARPLTTRPRCCDYLVLWIATACCFVTLSLYEQVDAQTKISPIEYKTPEGWMTARSNPLQTVGFDIVDGALKAKMTVVRLPPQSKKLLANVNRWRAQIGLEPFVEKNLESAVKAVKVHNTAGHYVELQSPDKCILAVIVPRDDGMWFFKMIGPPKLVRQQKMAFESFVRSVKFKDA